MLLYKLPIFLLVTSTLILSGCDGDDINKALQNDSNQAPVAYDDTLYVTEDTPKQERLRATDSDDDQLVFSISSPAKKGSVTITDESTGEFEYTPNENVQGSDSFTFEVSDGKTSASATISIKIQGVADKAIANDDQYRVAEGQTLKIDASAGILANDSAVDEGDSLRAPQITQTTQYGSLTVNDDGSFEYMHSGSEESSDSFSYTVSNSTGSATATVTITIDPLNDPPVASDDKGNGYLAGKSGTLNDPTLNILANDTDIEGDQLTAVLKSGPSKGSVTLNSDGTFSYTNDGSDGTEDSFTYQAKDSNGALSNPATVTIVINESPLAIDDSFTMPSSGWIITGNLLSNDSDPEGDPLSIVVTDVTQPQSGTISVNPNGTFSYSYDKKGAITDNFTYRATDGFGKSNLATVTLNIHTLPQAGDDQYSVIVGKTLNIDAASGVRNNDSDTETANNDLIASISKTPQCAANFVLNQDGSFSYTHNGDTNCKTDSFEYKITDAAGGSDAATARITILDNEPLAENDSYAVDEAGSLIVDFASGVLANDSDYDTPKEELKVTLVSAPSSACISNGGNFSLNQDGSFSYIHNGDDNCSSDSFEYRVTNNNGASSTATATITIDIRNDAPYFLPGHNGNSSNGSNEYEVLEFDLAGSKAKGTGLLRTVEDDENDQLMLRVISGPEFGTLKLGGIIFNGDSNTLYSEDFSYSYDGKGPFNYGDDLDLNKCTSNPATVFAGLTSDEIEAISKNESQVPFCWQNKDEIRVVAVDSAGNESEPSTRNIFLNVQPVANDDTAATTMDTPVVIDVFANDYDRDGAIVPSRVIISGTSDNGGTVVYENEKLTYTPPQGFTGTDTFTYQARDNKRVHWWSTYFGAPSNTATVTITVTADDGSSSNTVASNCRIMPLGDSITQGITFGEGTSEASLPILSERNGYRKQLYGLLSDYNIDFVGSQSSGNGSDNDHEGYPGRPADWIRDRVYTFLNNNPADIVLLHIGTNDLNYYNGVTPQDPGGVAAEISGILANINSWAQANGTTVDVLVAQIIDFNNPSNPKVAELNGMIGGMGSDSNINTVIVNQYAALTDRNPGGDWADEHHPSLAGYDKMASRWRDSLIPILENRGCLS